MSKKGILVGTLVLLVGLMIGLWVVNAFERVEIDSPKRYSGEAKHNLYYAAKIFMREMGYDARTIDISNLKKSLPDQNDTLIITTNRQTLGKDLSDDILNWVASGGHLIIQPAEIYFDYEDKDEGETNQDPILNKIGITAFYNFSTDYNGFTDTCSTGIDPADDDATDDDATDDVTVTEAEAEAEFEFKAEAEADKWSDQPGIYTFTNDHDDVELYFPPNQSLAGKTVDDFTLSDTKDTPLIHREYQKGAITTLVDLEFLTNNEIGKFDHARALINIINLDYGSSSSRLKRNIWILHDENMPSILALIWTHAFPVVVISLLMLILWLSGSLFRFGPLIPQPETERRQFLEHIDASGKYFWKNNQKSKLVNSTRSALDKRVSQMIPGWGQLSKQEQKNKMATILDMPESTLNNLMDTDSDLHSQDFTRLIRQLDNARKRL